MCVSFHCVMKAQDWGHLVSSPLRGLAKHTVFRDSKMNAANMGLHLGAALGLTAEASAT